jgi:hypothetical protein
MSQVEAKTPEYKFERTQFVARELLGGKVKKKPPDAPEAPVPPVKLPGVRKLVGAKRRSRQRCEPYGAHQRRGRLSKSSLRKRGQGHHQGTMGIKK